MGRLPALNPDEITGYQKDLYDRIAAARGAVRGPFNAWLYAPHLCDRVEALGKYVRFDSDIDMRLKEIAVLVIARHNDSDYVWNAHAKFARKHGVTDAVIEAIRQGQEPVFPNPDEKLAYDYTRELIITHKVSDATWAALVAHLDEARVVEFTAFIGNFTMVALAVNAFEVDLPSGAETLGG
ncbi:MAG: carboxymuconolactone decarboxylase family protein [Qingshengfaniella sp.]